MLTISDFAKKQIVFLFTKNGEKLSFLNDNIVIRDKEGKIKHQSTCYRLFIIFVVGEISITSGLIRRAKQFNFTICLMSYSFKLYSVIGTRMEGNVLLRKHQYAYNDLGQARVILQNKISNQRNALKSIRPQADDMNEAIFKLEQHKCKITSDVIQLQELLGIEGSAARTYFSQMFSSAEWKGRKPRIKCDYINTTLDIGYTMLFNIIDAILQVYGFDVYYGVLHKTFYMRKSLVCDVMEPFRPIVDRQIRKSINLGQCKEKDFEFLNNQYVLSYKKSPVYTSFLMECILENKEQIFEYIQSYYRYIMKQKDISSFPIFNWVV